MLGSSKAFKRYMLFEWSAEKPQCSPFELIVGDFDDYSHARESLDKLNQGCIFDRIEGKTVAGIITPDPVKVSRRDGNAAGNASTDEQH